MSTFKERSAADPEHVWITGVVGQLQIGSAIRQGQVMCLVKSEVSWKELQEFPRGYMHVMAMFESIPEEQRAHFHIYEMEMWPDCVSGIQISTRYQ